MTISGSALEDAWTIYAGLGGAPNWGHASSFYGRVVLEHTLSEEEHSQIVQTIEMFEVITQTQPDDYQSLEILKEAYQKVGRAEDSLKASRAVWPRPISTSVPTRSRCRSAR